MALWPPSPLKTCPYLFSIKSLAAPLTCLDNVQNLVGFFLMAPLITSDSQSKIDHLIVRLNLNSFTTTLFQGVFKYYGISQGGSMINTFVNYWEWCLFGHHALVKGKVKVKPPSIFGTVKDGWDVCKYASIQVCNYIGKQLWKQASMQLCKNERMQVCKYASMQVCKYASMQVFNYSSIQVRMLASMQIWNKKLKFGCHF